MQTNIISECFGNNPLSMVVHYFSSMHNMTFSSASEKFAYARKMAASDWAECADVTADEFWSYYKANKPKPYTRQAPPIDGDFDDMGCGATAGAYHYEQKRKHGKL